MVAYNTDQEREAAFGEGQYRASREIERSQHPRAENGANSKVRESLF
jgi:hypothetical protein